MQIIDGKQLAATIQEELKAEVKNLLAQGHPTPHLAAILVGNNPASAAYVRNKIKACEKAGFRSTLITYPETVTEAELLDKIAQLNEDPLLNGYIVQLPLPRHISEDKINLAISPDKDVDGFHPYNLGLMMMGQARYIPATPYGIMMMLERYNIETTGKHCVVIGRSNIVGTPMSLLMSRNSEPGNCTVTLVHSRSQDLKAETLRADIIIVAIGRANFLKADMVKPGAVVIDVGINSIAAPETKSGYRLVGDADFENLAAVCSYITPVPGGVGPMTVTALLVNTLKAYHYQQKQQ